MLSLLCVWASFVRPASSAATAATAATASTDAVMKNRTTAVNANETTIPVLVTVKFPSSKLGGSKLFLRGGLPGSGAPVCGLSWDNGIELAVSDSETDTWELVLECPQTDLGLEIKIAADDSTFELGHNHFISPEMPAIEIQPYFVETRGSFEVIDGIESEELGNVRSVVVYVPPGYNENPYLGVDGVIIMQDGQNLFDPATAFMGQAWMVQDTVDSLTANGNIWRVLIVGVYNTGTGRTDEYTNVEDPTVGGGGKADLYLDFLDSTIIPLVSERYRVPDLGDPANLGMIGASLGGLLSCYAAMTRDTYGRVGCMSASFWWANEDFLNNVIPASDPKAVVYLDSGTAGGDENIENTTIAVRDSLIGNKSYVGGGDLFYFLDQGGQHSERFWGHRFREPMEELYGLRPNNDFSNDDETPPSDTKETDQPGTESDEQYTPASDEQLKTELEKQSTTEVSEQPLS